MTKDRSDSSSSDNEREKPQFDEEAEFMDAEDDMMDCAPALVDVKEPDERMQTFLEAMMSKVEQI